MKTHFSCSKCMQSSSFYLKEVKNGTGVAVGQYCSNCHAWIKWVGKQQLSELSTDATKYYSTDRDNGTVESRILLEIARCKDVIKKLGEDLAKIEALLRAQEGKGVAIDNPNETPERKEEALKAPWEELE